MQAVNQDKALLMPVKAIVRLISKEKNW